MVNLCRYERKIDESQTTKYLLRRYYSVAYKRDKNELFSTRRSLKVVMPLQLI